MRNSLDAAMAVVLIALAASVAATAISIKAGGLSQSLAIAESERSAIAESEFALAHCPPKGIAACGNGQVFVNEVVALPPPSAGGFCVNRLVLLGGRVESAVFCK